MSSPTNADHQTATTSKTAQTTQTTQTPGQLIRPVLSDLESVVAHIEPAQFSLRTPCPDFDVEKLREHVLAWSHFFGFAFADPEGTSQRPAPDDFEAPADPGEAAAVIAGSTEKITAAVDDGIESGSVRMVQMSMPGSGALTFVMWEALMHGHDLAAATGQRWHPDDAASDAVIGFAQAMLTDEYRGPGKDFGPIVAVANDASPLDRLLGFSGRDPNWAPPTA